MEIGNYDLEIEWQTSKLLQGFMYPETYTDLRLTFNKLYDMPLAPTIKDLRKQLWDEDGLLKEPQVNSFYKGTNEKVLDLLKACASEVSDMLLYHKFSVETATSEIIDDLDNIDSPYGLDNFGELVSDAQLKVFYMEKKKEEDIEGRVFIEFANKLYSMYGVGRSEVLQRKPRFTTLSDKFLVFLKAYQLLMSDQGNLEVSTCVFKVIDIVSQFTEEELDPYHKDLLEELVDVFLYPEKYYTEYRTKSILSTIVASSFESIYPEFFRLYTEHAMETYNEIDYQSQINFQKSFNLPVDNSQLLSILSPAIQLGYVQKENI